MARGSSTVSVDAKGRIAIPTKHRDALMNASNGRMVVTISAEHRCLWLYTLASWEEVERKLISLPTLDPQVSRLKSMLIGHADDCDMDSNGRLLLPPELRKFAEIGKKATLIGQGDKFEIWDEEQWIAHRESFMAEEFDKSALPPELQTLAF